MSGGWGRPPALLLALRATLEVGADDVRRSASRSAADLLVIGHIELGADATVLRVDKQGHMIGGGVAAQRCPMIFRGLLRAEGLKKLGGGRRDLAVLRPIREFDALGVGEAFIVPNGPKQGPKSPRNGPFYTFDLRRCQTDQKKNQRYVPPPYTTSRYATRERREGVLCGGTAGLGDFVEAFYSLDGFADTQYYDASGVLRRGMMSLWACEWVGIAILRV